MAEQDKKNFIDPVTVSAVGVFTFKALAQGIIGWIGVSIFKKCWTRFKEWYGRSSQRIPEEESSKEA